MLTRGYEIAKLAVAPSSCTAVRRAALAQARLQHLEQHRRGPVALLIRTMGLSVRYEEYVANGDASRVEEQRGISGAHGRVLVPLEPSQHDVTTVLRSAFTALGGEACTGRAGLTPAAWLVELAVLLVLPGATAQPPHVDVMPRSSLSMATLFIPLQHVTATMGATVLFPAQPAEVASRSFFSALQHQANWRDEQRKTFSSDGTATGDDGEAEAQIRMEAAEDAAALGGLGPPVASQWMRYSRAALGLGTPVVMSLSTGDALLMDYRCFHYGGPNTTSKLRAVMYATFSEDRAVQGKVNDKAGEERIAHHGGGDPTHGSHASYSMPIDMQNYRLGCFL
jgi:hypothetical protein